MEWRKVKNIIILVLLLVNGFHQKPETPVKDGDIVALFPPVGGG